MAGPPPPPPPGPPAGGSLSRKQGNGSGAGQPSEVEAWAGRTALLLCGQPQPYDVWLSAKPDDGGEDPTALRKVLFTSAEVVRAMEPWTKRAFDAIEVFDNYWVSGAVEKRALELHPAWGFTHVACVSEQDILRAARIRDALGIPSDNAVSLSGSNGLTYAQGLDDAMRFRDKVLMKEILREAGIRVPDFAAVDSPLDLLAFLDTHELPVVVKPRCGYGSVNTAVLRTDVDVDACLAAAFSALDSAAGLEVESFVNGPMYHVDGLVFDGEVKAVWPSKYVNTVVDFTNNRFISAYSLAVGNPLLVRIQEYVVDVLTALDGPLCYSFHAEVWHTPDDELVFCEVASRTGGGGIPYQFLQLFGISLSKTFVQAQVGDPITLDSVDLAWRERMPLLDDGAVLSWIYVYPKVGRLASLPEAPSPEEASFILYYGAYAAAGAVYHGPASCGDAVACLIVISATEGDAEADIRRAYEWFEERTVWTPLGDAEAEGDAASH